MTEDPHILPPKRTPWLPRSVLQGKPTTAVQTQQADATGNGPPEDRPARGSGSEASRHRGPNFTETKEGKLPHEA